MINSIQPLETDSRRQAFSALDIQLKNPPFPLLVFLLLLLFFNFLYCLALSRSNMFFFQLVIMSGTVLLSYYMECTDLFGVHVQGFFCNDAELMKPYPGTEESSFIPPLILYCVVAAAPTAIIFIGEVSMYVMKSTREALLAQEKTIVTGDCCYLNPLIRRIIRFIGVFAFGLFATDIFVNAGQVVTGGLSPYFLSVCKPNYTGTECRFNHQFIINGNICTGNPVVVENARRSFPSKDASLSVYSAVYLTMYITSTIKTKSSRLAKPVLCLGTLCSAFLTGLNRVSEYRNHCSDVVAGFLLGSAVALFLGICVVNNFKGVHSATAKQKTEDYRGLPLMTFPRVESPLETLSAQNHSTSMTEVT
ncbi:phospholipid phosphatase-related protein type 1 isoform X1 [Etheostoma cragini]|uniref:phospholipid phosphatase-related protein type 1 isoform X1 n=1 Tax=Etheostoma cragini TaxID=417921 RepID=UPI00155E5373|nr:phospholipid phosphatase-related protein type 1 isoform X1 [Etheostoma cragini]